MLKTYKFKPEIGDILDNEFTRYLREVTGIQEDHFEYKATLKESNFCGGARHCGKIADFYNGNYTVTRSKSYLINKFKEICGNTYTQK